MYPQNISSALTIARRFNSIMWYLLMFLVVLSVIADISSPATFTTNSSGGGSSSVLVHAQSSSTPSRKDDNNNKKYNICWLAYFVADNSLESSMRMNLEHISNSSLVRDTAVSTWIYYDSRDEVVGEGGNNPFNLPNDAVAPIPITYGSDGKPLYDADDDNSSRNSTGDGGSGSRYLTFEHNLDHFVVDTTVDAHTIEQNSDNLSSVYNFASYALRNCIASYSSDEVGDIQFMFTMSSHGTGVGGVGGDYNVGNGGSRRSLSELEEWEDINDVDDGQDANGQSHSTSRRNLLLANGDLVSALRQALIDASQDMETPKNKWDLIGFDASLMSNYQTLLQYYKTTDYFIASETLVPSHGTFCIMLLLDESITAECRSTSYLTQLFFYSFILSLVISLRTSSTKAGRIKSWYHRNLLLRLGNKL